MPITPTPLEKQLLNLDLGKGMDERTRPELNGNLTTIENLLQDQSGAWVKRGGTGDIRSSDGTGTSSYPLYPRKIVQLVNGWGVVADFGRLLVKQEAQLSYRARQYVMDFGVAQANIIGSSGPGAQTIGEGSLVMAVASNSGYDCYMMARQTLSGTSSFFKLTICERATGIEYVYDYKLITFASGSTNNNAVKMVFINDRYLQIYTTGNYASTSGNIDCVTIDTALAMPVNEAAITPTAIAGGLLNLWDVTADTTQAYVLWSNVGGTVVRTLHTVDTTGVITQTAAYPAAELYKSLAVNEATATVWMMSAATSASLQLQAVSSAAIGTVTTAVYNPGCNGTYVCADFTNNTLLITYNTEIAFGASALSYMIVSTIATPGAAAVVRGGMYGWKEASLPFFSNVLNKFYMHMTKSDLGSGGAPARAILGELGTNAIVDLSTFTPFSRNLAGLTTPFGSFRIACCLEPFFGFGRVGLGQYRYRCFDSYSFSACVPFQTFRGTAGIAFYRCAYSHPASFGSCNFGGSSHIAHGGINSYDGRNLYECGIVDQPVSILATPGATAGNLNGSYRYYAVFRHTDANGAAAYGRVYGPLTSVNVAASTGRNNFVIQPYGLTNRDSGKSDSMPIVEVFRTKSGGTQFYLVASSQDIGLTTSTTPLVTEITKDTTTGLLSFQDNTSDTTLGSQPIMYRQPGTTNSPADRYAPPAARFCIQHKDRIFCTDPFGQRVCYSSFFVDGEQPWFNPAFNFFVHAGSGPITALASMDGRLFIFKRDAIFVVDGDGPGEAGPTGNEFSPPQSLASVYGCVDHRSVVVTPKGIMYRSVRGIEMLTRSLQVDWIGERVDTTVDANPITTGSCIDAASRVHWTLAVSESAGGVYYVNGVELVYDMSCDAWSVHRYTGTDGIYGHALGCIATVSDVSVSKVAVGFGYSGVAPLSTANYADSLGYYVPFKIESGWMKQGPQARQRVTDLLFLAKKAATSNHAIKISIAYNYSDTYTQTHTFEPDVINALGIEELELQPSTQQVLAIRVKIEDQAPADIVTYPVGLGAGCDILSITAEVAAKPGSPKLAAGQKA